MSAGITAARAGRRVVLIERSTLGGTCVNVGCIPSKMLLAAAGTRHAALTNPFPGAPTSAGRADLGTLVTQKDELVQRLRGAKYLDVAKAYGFEVRPGQARFTSPDTLEVNGTALLAGAFVVATGAEPAVPDLPGLDGVNFLTSTTAMELVELPTSLVVVGGGYVGMEQAQLFAHLGAQVTVVGRLAPQAEPELADTLRTVFAADGITVVEDRAVGVEPGGGGVVVVTGSGRRVTGQRLLVATGRRPRTDGLNLPAAEVVTDGRGFIVIDEQQATSNPRVFAAGDVAGSPQYVYVAAAGGRVAATNALQDDSSRPACCGGLRRDAGGGVHPAAAGLGRAHRAAGARRRIRLRLPRLVPGRRAAGVGEPGHPRGGETGRRRRHRAGARRPRRRRQRR